MNQNIQNTPKKKTPVSVFSLISCVLCLLCIITKSFEYFQNVDYFGSISALIYIIIYYLLYAVGFAMIGICSLMNPEIRLIGNKVFATALCIISVAMSMPFLSVFATGAIYLVFNGEFITANAIFAFPVFLLFAISCFSGKTGGLLRVGRTLFFINGIIYCALNIVTELEYIEYTPLVSLCMIVFHAIMLVAIIMISGAVKAELPPEVPKPRPQPQFRQAPPNYRPMGMPQYRPPYAPQGPQQSAPKFTVNENGEKVVTPQFSNQPSNVYKNEKDEIEHVKEIGERILKVKELYEKGIITEREYLDKRAELMSQL